MTNLERNIEEYKKYILETLPEPHLNPALQHQWVLEMLEALKTDRVINPEWIRAKYSFQFIDLHKPLQPPPAMWITDKEA